MFWKLYFRVTFNFYLGFLTIKKAVNFLDVYTTRHFSDTVKTCLYPFLITFMIILKVKLWLGIRNLCVGLLIVFKNISPCIGDFGYLKWPNVAWVVQYLFYVSSNITNVTITEHLPFVRSWAEVYYTVHLI